MLETNVDDVSGEVIAHAITRFMEAGARDACAMPVIMKKGRPGFLIRVISLPEHSVTARGADGTRTRHAGYPLHPCSSPVHR